MIIYPRLPLFRERSLHLIIGVLLVFVVGGVKGQVNIAAFNVPYTENFNSLASAGSSNALPNGWYLFETGSNSNLDYSADDGSTPAGNTYSYGTAASTDRALGGLRSGSLNSTIGAHFINNTGGTITRVTILYIGEQWRLGNTGRFDRLDFQYSTNATGLNNGTWTDFNPTCKFTSKK